MDLVRLQDVGLSVASDPDVLDWAAQEGRVLLTHDVNTLVGFAWERVAAGLPMPGVLAVPADAPIGSVVEDLVLLHDCGRASDLERQVLYLPLCDL